MEKIYNPNKDESPRSAPLFEFRNLLTKETSEFEQFMKDVDTSIQKLHKEFAAPPTKKKLRRDAPASCTIPKPTPTGGSGSDESPSPTFVDPPSPPICLPKPTSHIKDAHEREVVKVAKYFCDKYATKTDEKGPVYISETVMAGLRPRGKVSVDIAFDYPPSVGNQDDVYDVGLNFVPNCTPNGLFNLAEPVKDHSCADILHTAWRDCECLLFYTIDKVVC